MELDTARLVNIMISGRRLAISLYELWLDGKTDDAELSRTAVSEKYKQIEEQEKSKNCEWYTPTLAVLEKIPANQQIRLAGEITAAKANINMIVLSPQESSEAGALQFEDLQEVLCSILKELQEIANSVGTTIPSYERALAEMAPIKRDHI